MTEDCKGLVRVTSAGLSRYDAERETKSGFHHQRKAQLAKAANSRLVPLMPGCCPHKETTFSDFIHFDVNVIFIIPQVLFLSVPCGLRTPSGPLHGVVIDPADSVVLRVTVVLCSAQSGQKTAQMDALGTIRSRPFSFPVFRLRSAFGPAQSFDIKLRLHEQAQRNRMSVAIIAAKHRQNKRSNR
jgi:hypothetical protein